MNEEIKDFFIRNGGESTLIHLALWVDDFYFYISTTQGFLQISGRSDEYIDIETFDLQRIKALILGLTGKNLE